MNRRILWALVACNVLLAVSLAMRVTRDNSAVAQVKRPSDYILIPGDVPAGSTAVVYMIDTTNGWLGAMAYDDATHVLNAMPPLDLGRVFETSGGPRTPGNTPPRGGAR